MIASDNIVLNVLCFVVSVYSFILFAYVILGWLFLFGVRRPYSGPGRVLLDALDAVVLPVIRPLGRIVPPVRMGGVGLDLSVLVAFVILIVLQRAVCR